MKRKEIWQYVLDHGIETRRVMHKFVKLTAEDFDTIAKYFDEVRHFSKKYDKNYRTPNLWRHLHATKKGNIYEVHKDFGNPNRKTLLTAVPHFLFDMVPYFFFRLIQSFLSIFNRS